MISECRLIFLIQDYNKTLKQLSVRIGEDAMSSSEEHAQDDDEPNEYANLSGSIIGKNMPALVLKVAVWKLTCTLHKPYR